MKMTEIELLTQIEHLEQQAVGQSGQEVAAEQARAIARDADGVVVGSALVSAVEKSLTRRCMCMMAEHQ